MYLLLIGRGNIAQHVMGAGMSLISIIAGEYAQDVRVGAGKLL